MKASIIFALLIICLISGVFATIEQYATVNYYDPPLNPLTGELRLNDSIHYERIDVDCVEVDDGVCVTYLFKHSNTCFHSDGVFFKCEKFKDRYLKELSIFTANEYLQLRGEPRTKGNIIYTIPALRSDTFCGPKRETKTTDLLMSECLLKCGDEKNAICTHADDCKAWVVEEGVHVVFKEKSNTTDALIFEIFIDDPKIIEPQLAYQRSMKPLIETLGLFCLILFGFIIRHSFGDVFQTREEESNKEK